MKRLTHTQISTLMRHPWGWLASGLGSGLAPFAPGTAGSLAALLPYVVLREYGPWAIMVAGAILFFLGIAAAQWVIDRLGHEDPGVVVIDEWIGLWITLLPALWYWPRLGFTPGLAMELVLGFLIFRWLDIWKPWPVSVADKKLHGGFGSMFDDLLAGVYGALAMAFAVPWLWKRFFG